MPNAAECARIKARLDRETLSIFQGYLLQPRLLVNFEPEPVAGPVEKSNILAVANFSRITALFEQGLDRLVDFHSVDAFLDFAERELLSFQNGLPKFALRVARFSSHHRSRHVAPVTRLCVARKNIEDDQRVREERTMPALVRIGRLIAAGANRVDRKSTRLN